jgi:hypothetical protein
MRGVFFCLLLLTGLGCKHAQSGHGECAECAALHKAGCVGHDGLCSHHAAGHTCPICEKKKEKAAPRAGPEERETVVTQDVMLVPRMVYVPYAPQVPVAPVRMANVVPGARSFEQPKEAPPEKREAPPPPPTEKVICETLDRCAQMMQIMDKRLCDLEQRLQNPPAPPPVIIQEVPGPRCFPSLFGKPHLPCLGSLCDKP